MGSIISHINKWFYYRYILSESVWISNSTNVNLCGTNFNNYHTVIPKWCQNLLWRRRVSKRVKDMCKIQRVPTVMSSATARVTGKTDTIRSAHWATDTDQTASGTTNTLRNMSGTNTIRNKTDIQNVSWIETTDTTDISGPIEYRKKNRFARAVSFPVLRPRNSWRGRIPPMSP